MGVGCEVFCGVVFLSISDVLLGFKVFFERMTVLRSYETNPKLKGKTNKMAVGKSPATQKNF